MKRSMLLALCACLALAPAASAAAKKPKKVSFGPMRTVIAVGPLAAGGLGGSESSTAVATCPRGTKVISGGFAVTLQPTNKVAVDSSFRSSSRSWTVRGNAIQGAGQATAYAYCRKTTAKISSASASAVTPADPLGSATTTAACPPGTKVISGGFQGTRSEAPAGLVSFGASNPTPSGWTVTGFNSVPVSQTVTAHAYCAQKAKTLVRTGTASGPVLENGVISATSSPCPKLKGKNGKKKKKVKRLSAGGFTAPPPDLMTTVFLMAESRIAGGGWQSAAFNNNDDSPGATLTTTGLCL